MRIININSKIRTLFAIGVAVLLTACEEDHEVVRSKDLNIYGPTEVYVGDYNTFEAPLYTLDDTRTWSWSVEGSGASDTEGEGEFFDVAFNQLGTFTVTLAEGSRAGSIEVEAISKVLLLGGDTTVVSEGAEDTEVAIPISIDNYVADEIAVAYTIDGSAVEGVDYELISDNPLILDSDSEDEDYAIYINMLADVTPESSNRTVRVTITSVTPTLEGEVVLSDSSELLISAFEIVDDLKVASVRNIATEEVNEPGVVSFEVVLSNESAYSVTVNYSLAGSGVSDVTPDGGGTLTFAPGETSKVMYLQFNASAFAGEQTVTVTLNSITSADNEASVNPERNSKSFKVE